MFPKAPSGFVKRLHEMDPTLQVACVGPGGWVFHQLVKKWVYAGQFRGCGFFILKEVPEYVGRFPYLGDRVINDLRKSWSGNYKGYEDFCKENRIYTETDAVRDKVKSEKLIAEMLRSL